MFRQLRVPVEKAVFAKATTSFPGCERSKRWQGPIVGLVDVFTLSSLQPWESM